MDMEPTHDNTARSTETSKAEGRLVIMKRAVNKYKKNGRFANDGKGGPGVISNPLGFSAMGRLEKMGIKPSPNASASDAPVSSGGVLPGGVAPAYSKKTKGGKSAVSGAKSSIKALKMKIVKNAIKGVSSAPKIASMKKFKIPKVKGK